MGAHHQLKPVCAMSRPNETHAHGQCLPNAGSYVAAVASCSGVYLGAISFDIDVLTQLMF